MSNETTIEDIKRYYKEFLNEWQEITAPSGFDAYLNGFIKGEVMSKIEQQEALMNEMGEALEEIIQTYGYYIEKDKYNINKYKNLIQKIKK